MLSIVGKIAALALVVLASAPWAHAVCASGQLAVGIESVEDFCGENCQFEVFAGFLMANDCGLISQNPLTQDSNEMCEGGYTGGASVTCNSNGQPIAAVDTEGQHWTCHETSDISCNVGGSAGEFEVQACCDRD